MNQHIHKVIFNKTTGRMDVVSEIVSAQGGATLASANEHPHPAWHHSITQFLIKPVAFALMLSLGTAQILPAQAQVIADPSAPKSQQPTVLPTASGATQINIQTPSAAGVSMNQYKQFDTQTNGTVLNNSRTNTNTQTAGWIQANPWLATGSARVIVNQVNSSNPSRLTGNIEVAGQRADLIIANPSGININGAAIINANRTTFTTGVPQLANGSLTGYQVNQGQINVEGTGLNAMGSDYTDLLARAVKVNAGIWANNLAITTGANSINADNSQFTANTVTGTTPSLAIDTSALGGMYAGKITLIGTENGVGVNNAGQIAASAGNVTISANGMLSNSGTINSNGAENTTQIQSTQLANTGSISSQGNTQIQTAGLTNSGTIAAGREAKLTATELNNSTGTINGQRIDITANSLNNTQGKIQQTGTQALALNAGSISNLNNGLIGYEPLDSGSGTGSTGTGTGSTGTGTTTPPSTATGGGSSTVVQPTPVVLADGQINVQSHLNNDAGRITANGGMDLTASNGLNNHGILYVQNFKVTGNQLDNNNGKLTVKGLFSINTQKLNNQAGSIIGEGLDLKHQTVNNQNGSIQALQNIRLIANTSLNNDSGVITANQGVELKTERLQNRNKGTISSVKESVDIKTQELLDNNQGNIKSYKNLNIIANGIDNDEGLLGAGQNLLLEAKTGQVSNETGNLIAGTSLNLITTADFKNYTGQVSAQSVQIHSAVLDNSLGQIISAEDTQITSQALSNEKGLVYAGTDLNINTQGQGLINEQTNVDDLGIIALNKLIIRSGNLLNSQGKIQSQQTVDIQATDINNIQGNIQAQNNKISANNLNNKLGQIGAKGNNTLNLNRDLLNQGGQIWSESTSVTTKSLLLDNSTQGLISAKGVLDIQTSNLDNHQGSLSAGVVKVLTDKLNNQGGLIESNNQTMLNVIDIDNQEGEIMTSGELNVITSTQNLAGQLSADGKVNFTAQADLNNAAKISSGDQVTLNTQNLTNQGLIAGKSLSVTANQIHNQSTGELSSQQVTQLQVSGILKNQGLIDGASTLIQTNATDNSGRIYADQLALLGDLNNHDTGVIATRKGELNLAGKQLVNQNGGLIHSEGDLNIGGSLDANYQINSSADIVDNIASTIESQNNMSIASNKVNNRNIGFSYSTREITENIPQETYIRFFRAKDPNLATTLFKVDELGRCYMCGDGIDQTPFSTNPKRLEYVPPSELYPFELGYLPHTYQTSGTLTLVNGTWVRTEQQYSDQNPVWNLFGVMVGDYDSLVPKLKAYNDDYIQRARAAGIRDYYSVYINQKITNQSQIDNSGQAAVISSGGNMSFIGSDIFNDNSKIIAGDKLVLKNDSAIRNRESYGAKQVELKGTWSGDNIEYDPYRIRRGYFGNGNYSQIVSDETIKLSNDLVQEHLGGYITGIAPTANNPTTTNISYVGSNKNIDSVNTQTAQSLKDWNSIRNTYSDAIIVPNNSLFSINPNSTGSYVQTDPRFTSHGKWLSSDYMLSQLKIDPANIHKRLGDGYYEQKLIKEQIAQLTGRRYLGDYHNDDTQYQALMNAGVTFAGQYNLRPGIALTPEQLARLTSDIVWLVEETVTLPNGSKVQALVPKVYVVVKPNDVTGDGALISADSMDLNLSGNLDNSGTLLGRQLIKVNANNITNSGLIQSNLIDARAQLDFNNIGGIVNAHTAMNIEAGRDVNVVSTTNSAQSRAGLSNSTLTQVDRVAGFYVGNGSDSVADNQALTSLSVKAGRDVNLTGAVLSNDSQGQTIVNADGNINLNSVQTQSGLDLVASDVNNAKYLATDQVGSQINTVGNIQFKAGDSITATAADINSETGKVILTATNDVNLLNGQSQLNYESNSYHKESGLFSSSMRQTHQRSQTNTTTSTNVTGQQVLIQAGHDANIVGSNVVSDNLTQINADHDVNILATQNSQTSEGFSINKQSGLMGTGGFGFMIGSKQNSTDADHTNTFNVASNVGSLNGDVNLSAGNHYQQTGSNVTAGHVDAMGQFVSAGDVNITAKDVDIVAGQDTYATDTVTKSKQSGLTVAVSVPIVNAVMAVADTAQTVGQSKNSRVNAMSAANTAMAGYQAAEALKGLKDIDSIKDLNVSASITVGSSQSKSETHAKGTEAVASNVVGKNVNITATGAGKDSNIHVIGSEIAGTHATTLKADNNVTLESAQSTSEEHSSNKSSGWNAGVAIGTQGIGFTFGGNYGKGHGDGTSVTQVNSHVGSSTGTTTIVAGDTTTLAGAQVQGNQVNIDAQNLAIESRQDTAKYDSKQNNISGQATIGAGASLSGSYSNSKINADYASVNEQSGIMAGDGGYSINVKQHTDLKGGIITSTQAAEDAGRNQMSTGTLTASNIQNHADYDASGFGVSGGVELGKAGSGGTDKDTGKNLGVGADNRSLGVNKSLGYGADEGHNASTTVSGINTQNLTITNTAGQAQLMGKPTDTSADVIANEVKQSIYTSTTTDQVQANSGAIANNFDKDAVQSEIDLQIKVTQQFDTTRQQAKTIVNQHIDSLNKALKEAEDALKVNPDDAVAQQKYKDTQASINNWQIGGTIIDSIASGLSGPTSTGAAGILANAAAPALQYRIGQYFKGTDAEGSTAHILAHTVIAAAVAAAGGNDALMAGLAAGGAEAVAPAVANWLFGSNPDVKKDAKGNVIASELTADQKNTLSNIIGLGTVGATGLAGGSVTDVVNSTGLAQTTAEDNGNTRWWEKRHDGTQDLSVEMIPTDGSLEFLMAMVNSHDASKQEKARGHKNLLADNMTYEVNAKHVPGAPGYDPKRGGDLPEDARRSFARAQTYDGGKTWFASSEDGKSVYRYQASNGTVHWNGSTSDIRHPLDLRTRTEYETS